MSQKTRLPLFAVLSGLLVLGLTVFFLRQAQATRTFDGNRAYQDVVEQVGFGPRIPGTPEHARTIEWILSQLKRANWQVEVLDQPYNGLTARNIVAKRGTGSQWIILGAHYDSRRYADQDPDARNQTQPVPGANDGASGVAVLLELARTLPPDIDKEIWLVFFDLEDQGGIDGRDYIEGSNAFAQSLPKNPTAVVIVDMIGDADLNIHFERTSDRQLKADIWQTAADLGYASQFIASEKYAILDDHTPFLQKGIPAVDLIDFDYPYWHTIGDTPDKVSAQSLKTVGDTLWHWIQRK